MYLKVFESRQTPASYILRYVLHKEEIGKGTLFLENERHSVMEIEETELYYLLDNFFKAKLNEIRKGQESSDSERHKA